MPAKLTAADLALTQDDAEICIRMPFKTESAYIAADDRDASLMKARTRFTELGKQKQDDCDGMC